jgi:hypothetical protein
MDGPETGTAFTHGIAQMVRREPPQLLENFPRHLRDIILIPVLQDAFTIRSFMKIFYFIPLCIISIRRLITRWMIGLEWHFRMDVFV